jgi:hypothetical protein
MLEIPQVAIPDRFNPLLTHTVSLIYQTPDRFNPLLSTHLHMPTTSYLLWMRSP